MVNLTGIDSLVIKRSFFPNMFSNKPCVFLEM